MDYLLDTCTALYLWGGSPDLSDRAKAVIRDTRNTLWLHQVSYLEITLKHSIGKLPLSEAPFVLVPKALSAYQIRFTNLSNKDIAGLEHLPFHHRDPFDRLLVSHALNTEMTVLTPDAVFLKYGVKVVW